MAGPTEAKGEGKCKCLLIGMQGQWVGQPLTIRRLLPSILFFNHDTLKSLTRGECGIVKMADHHQKGTNSK